VNKQQLAAKIWESANKMRSKIEANDYKDYILGFIFYKFLSDKEVRFMQGEGATAEDIKQLSEEDAVLQRFPLFSSQNSISLLILSIYTIMPRHLFVKL
jgi:type I restriction enzyme M protein